MTVRYIICLFFVLVNCHNANETKKGVNIKIKKLATKKTFDYNNHSDFFYRTLNLLKNENYTVKSFTQDSTKFIAYEAKNSYPEHKIVKQILAPNIKKTTYTIKRKYPTRKGGNDFVKFNFSELYFKNDSIAKKKKNEIDSIIEFTDRIDIFNDKNYDYTVQKSNRIIYVSCQSKYHSYSSDSLKPKIEKLSK